MEEPGPTAGASGSLRAQLQLIVAAFAGGLLLLVVLVPLGLFDEPAVGDPVGVVVVAVGVLPGVGSFVLGTRPLGAASVVELLARWRTRIRPTDANLARHDAELRGLGEPLPLTQVIDLGPSTASGGAGETGGG